MVTQGALALAMRHSSDQGCTGAQLEGIVNHCFPQHSGFSFIWFFKMLAVCNPCCCSFPIWTTFVWCLLSPQTLCLQLHAATHDSDTSSHIPLTPDLAQTKHLSPAPPQPHSRRERCPRSCSLLVAGLQEAHPVQNQHCQRLSVRSCSPSTALGVWFHCVQRAPFTWGQKEDLTHQVPAGSSMGRLIPLALGSLTALRAPPSPASPSVAD